MSVVVAVWLGLTVAGLTFAVVVTVEAWKAVQATHMLNGDMERTAAKAIFRGQMVRVFEFLTMLAIGVAGVMGSSAWARLLLLVLAGLIALNSFLAWRDGRRINANLFGT